MTLLLRHRALCRGSCGPWALRGVQCGRGLGHGFPPACMSEQLIGGSPEPETGGIFTDLLCDFGWINLMILFFPPLWENPPDPSEPQFLHWQSRGQPHPGLVLALLPGMPSCVQLGHPAQSRRRDDCIGAMFAEEERAWTWHSSVPPVSKETALSEGPDGKRHWRGESGGEREPLE